MPLTTTITPAHIAVALGVSAPDSGSQTEAQWEMWIADALMLIQARVDSIDPVPTVEQAPLDYVIREAVVAQVRRPDDATQVTVSIDDGSTSKTYRSSSNHQSSAIATLPALERYVFEVDPSSMDTVTCVASSGRRTCATTASRIT